MARRVAATTVAQWRIEQHELKQRLIESDAVKWQLDRPTTKCATLTDKTSPCQVLQKVAGVDISFLKGLDEHACAAMVVLDFPSMTLLYEAFTYVALPAPYIVGFLAFREVPALTKLLIELRQRRPDLLPDVILVDGNGVLHPQGFGLASHFGVVENVPTIGVGKTFLHVDGLTKSDVKQLMATARAQQHNVVKLTGKSGRVWGAALCSTAAVKNPVYVSVGHALSLDTCVRIVQACSQYRVPEPIRLADLQSREVVRQWESTNRVDISLDRYRAYRLLQT